MNNEDQLLVSEEIFEETEREIEIMLAQFSRESGDSSERRVNSIMKRVELETVMKESTDFLVEGFSSGLRGILGAFSGLAEKDPRDKGKGGSV